MRGAPIDAEAAYLEACIDALAQKVDLHPAVRAKWETDTHNGHAFIYHWFYISGAPGLNRTQRRALQQTLGL